MKLLLTLLFLPILALAAPKKDRILLDFGSDVTEENIDTDPRFGPLKRLFQENGISLLCSDLKEDLHTSRVANIVVCNKTGAIKRENIDRIPKDKAIFFIWEPPVVMKILYSKRITSHFKRIYTWDDDLVDDKRFFKFYYPAYRPLEKELPPFRERGLLTLINGNKTSKHPQELYSERKKVIEFFEGEEGTDFTFYGGGWEDKRYKNYGGAVADKIKTLKKYRFCICYENMRDVKGYVTEKIFDCLAAGCVPVYWGASNIDTYVPKGCYVDRRDFESTEALYRYLQKVSEKEYQAYVEEIGKFLGSDQAKLFSLEMFQTIFLEALRFP